MSVFRFHNQTSGSCVDISGSPCQCSISTARYLAVDLTFLVPCVSIPSQQPDIRQLIRHFWLLVSVFGFHSQTSGSCVDITGSMCQCSDSTTRHQAVVLTFLVPHVSVPFPQPDIWQLIRHFWFPVSVFRVNNQTSGS